jgi:hypothetical protein
VSGGRRGRLAAAAAAVLLSLCGCGSLAADEVESVGAAFAAADGDPAEQCELLTANTRTALVEEESSTCEEAIGLVPLGAGEVTSVEVWGEEAQVRLTDDTLFLTRTTDGWRVSAAACTPQGEERPYDCQLEAS